APGRRAVAGRRTIPVETESPGSRAPARRASLASADPVLRPAVRAIRTPRYARPSGAETKRIPGVRNRAGAGLVTGTRGCQCRAKLRYHIGCSLARVSPVRPG